MYYSFVALVEVFDIMCSSFCCSWAYVKRRLENIVSMWCAKFINPEVMQCSFSGRLIRWCSRRYELSTMNFQRIALHAMN